MNNNITEDYCSFEVSKLLKEKGFDIYSESYYLDNTKELMEYVGCYNTLDQEKDNPHSIRPTHSLAIKWIRENFGIHIFSTPQGITTKYWLFGIFYTDPKKGRVDYDTNNRFDTCEESIEAALLHTLKNLI